MPPLGAGWDADVWMAPCNQDETHFLGLLPRPEVEYWYPGCPLTTRRGPSHHLGVLWGGSGAAVGGCFPITFCTVGAHGVAVILRGLSLQQHIELPNLPHFHCSDKKGGSHSVALPLPHDS